MKPWLKYIVFGLLAYLLFLIIRFPASIAYRWVEKEMQPITLSAVSGTVWSGHADGILLRGSDLGKMDWRFSPLALLGAKLGFVFEVSGPRLHAEGTGGVTLGGTAYFAPINGVMDAGLLETVPRFRVGKIKGNLEYRLEELELSKDGHVLSVNGKALWKGAGIVQPITLSLGDVDITLTSDNGDIIAEFSGEGALTLDGQTIIEPDGRFTVNGFVLPRPSAPPALVAALRSFGKETPGGKIELDYTGRL